MITFRYHLVSLIVVLFALAFGVILGAGPLKDNVDQTLTSQVSELRRDNQGLRDQITALQGTGAYREDYDSRVQGALTTGQLVDADIVVVALPGADGDLVSTTRDALRAAGGTITGTVSINDKWFDPASDKALNTLALQLTSSGTTLPSGNGYVQGAAVLAAALVRKPDDVEDPQSDKATLDGLRQADFLSVDGDFARRAGFAVVVAGPAPTGSRAEAQTKTLIPVPRALDAGSQGVVVGGPAGAAAQNGVIAAIRNDGDAAQAISTVDVLDLSSGRTATVFALIEQGDGKAGHYGVVGKTDGPLPPGFASTIAAPSGAPSPSGAAR